MVNVPYDFGYAFVAHPDAPRAIAAAKDCLESR